MLALDPGAKVGTRQPMNPQKVIRWGILVRILMLGLVKANLCGTLGNEPHKLRTDPSERDIGYHALTKSR